MKLAVMQPYLFPYIGYFQLICAVDAFVIYDDVNYITGGWINRNYILAPEGKQRITLPVEGASQNKLINEIAVGHKRKKITETIRQRYSKAPFFAMAFPLIEEILNQNECNLARFLEFQLLQVCSYLGLNRQWMVSSNLKKTNVLRGQEKILAICKELSADHYINLYGGKELYDPKDFLVAGKKISFIKSNNACYRQFGTEFVPNLSIIDLLMFNDKTQCLELLEKYELV
jgi:hypothetical protein